ncbi:flagellar hook assembly protein FlgD [Anaeromyxobacter sp. Red801]
MSTSPVTSALGALPQPGQAPAPASSALGKDAFLKLLTTQLQHQDPLSPMDSQAFVAQLAQFSSVEQLGALGDKLDTLAVAQASSNQLGTAALVGKEVLFRADRVRLDPGAPARFEVTLPADAGEAVAILADASGRVVRTLPLGAREAGTFPVSWDGRDASGEPLPAGDYLLTVSATRADGTELDAATSLRGTVTGVTFENQAPELLVGGRHVKLSDVLQLAAPAA